MLNMSNCAWKTTFFTSSRSSADLDLSEMSDEDRLVSMLSCEPDLIARTSGLGMFRAILTAESAAS